MTSGREVMVFLELMETVKRDKVDFLEVTQKGAPNYIFPYSLFPIPCSTHCHVCIKIYSYVVHFCANWVAGMPSV